MNSSTNGANHDPEENPDPESDTDAIFAELESSLDSPSVTNTDSNHDTSDLATSPGTSSILAARKAELLSQARSSNPTSTGPSGTRSHPTQIRGTGQIGSLETASSEEGLIRATADAAGAVVVFYSADFATSLLMKEHVSALAREYAAHSSPSGIDRDDEAAETVFFAAEAEKCEWLCRRLGIRVLPVVVGYVDGKEVGRIVGFDGLRGGEKASWKALAWVIGRWSSKTSGTLSVKEGNTGVLGRGWEDWVGGSDEANGGRRTDASGSEDEELVRNRRRAAGFIGGSGGGNSALRSGARSKLNARTEDEDDDWD